MTKGKKKGEASDAREKMWLVMRGLGTFTVDEIATVAEVPYEAARCYIYRLRQAGYLRQDGKVKGPVLLVKQYRLIKNTGPKAPIERKVVMLYDPNTETSQEVANSPLIKGDKGGCDVA